MGSSSSLSVAGVSSRPAPLVGFPLLLLLRRCSSSSTNNNRRRRRRRRRPGRSALRRTECIDDEPHRSAVTTVQLLHHKAVR